jgi:hypothetical protein
MAPEAPIALAGRVTPARHRQPCCPDPAEVLKIDIEEVTSTGSSDQDGQHAYPAAPLIEQAVMQYGMPPPTSRGLKSSAIATYL